MTKTIAAHNAAVRAYKQMSAALEGLKALPYMEAKEAGLVAASRAIIVAQIEVQAIIDAAIPELGDAWERWIMTGERDQRLDQIESIYD